jgi:hypothetical protein
LRVAITQPTYLPWLGFFALIDSCDSFMLLDDVQFVKRSWMQRNRLYDSELGKIRYLTVPIHEKRGDKIAQVTVADNKWKTSHYNVVRHLFRKAPYLGDVEQVMKILFRTRSRLLVDYTMPIIERIIDILGIDTPIFHSSDFPGHNDFVKTRRLAYLIESLGGSVYLAQPTAVQAYLDLNMLKQDNLDVELFQYDHPHYSTGSAHFEPNMSVLEFIGWVAPSERLDLMRSGVKISTLVKS